MTFGLLTPLMLAGLALVALPIIIHLIFRRQPKHVVFPAFRFLKQRHRRSMRKLRLRHLLLLFLRMGLIALVCFALARPWLGFGSEPAPSLVAGSQPVAGVLVFDTSMSMAYPHGGQTPLDRAKALAGAFVSKLPQGSQVAVVDTHMPLGRFQDPGTAIRVIEKLSPRARSVPVTVAINEGLDLLAKSPPRMSAVFCVFSDRTAASWDSGQVSAMRAKRDALSAQFQGGLPCVYVDLSVPHATNVAVIEVAVRAGFGPLPLDRLGFGVPADAAVELEARVRAYGGPAAGELELVVGGQTHDIASFQIQASSSGVGEAVVLFQPLRPTRGGVLQGMIRLRGGDALSVDDRRFWTLSSAQRRALIVTDRPSDAHHWRTALDNLGILLPLACTVVAPTDVPSPLRPNEYQAVVLMNVARPSDELWTNLQSYVAEGGGLVVGPGEDAEAAAYNTESAQTLLPARLRQVVQAVEGGTFLDLSDATHEIPETYTAWNADLTVGKVYKLWEVEPAEGKGELLARYDWGDRPAILHSLFDRNQVRGRVLLFTTALYRRTDANAQDWNNWYKHWPFSLALPYLSVRYVMGAQAEQQNFTLGRSAVQFWLPRGAKLDGYVLSGPLTASDEIKPDQLQLTLPEAQEPGNYEVANTGAVVWQRAFSVNLLPEETDLRPVAELTREIEALLGEGCVVGADKAPDLRSLIKARLGQEDRLELLALLMLAVVVMLALENLLSNRFYRHDTEEEAGP